MSNFHTRTIPLHSVVCRVCGKAFQSVSADHVADWIVNHDACVPLAGWVPVPDREWED